MLFFFFDIDLGSVGAHGLSLSLGFFTPRSIIPFAAGVAPPVARCCRASALWLRDSAAACMMQIGLEQGFVPCRVQ